MGFFWFALTTSSCCAILVKNPEVMLGALTEGAKKAVGFATYMLPIYAVWLGILELMDHAKLTEKIAKILMPVTKFLFGDQPQKTRELLASNIAGNLIGVGAVATPSGILASKEMQGESETILKSTIMLIILNSSSLQIVPTTIISMRAQAGSASSSSIFLPALISSVLTTVVAILLVKCFVKEKIG